MIKEGDVIFVHDGWVPYRNRWGNWVFRPVDMAENRYWPGFKKSKTFEPVRGKDGVWRWAKPSAEDKQKG